MATTTLTTQNFSNLDFDSSRQAIVDYLSTRTEFQDFNFNGPAISILLDALAYTNHQMAIYANMSLSEVFLDSAQLRSSVVSRAKEIGYIPRSMATSYAQVRLSVNLGSANTGLGTIPLAAGSLFSSQIGQTSFTFRTTEDYVLSELMDISGVVLSANQGIYFADIVIREGTSTTETFVCDGTNNQLFTLSNKNIDIDYIQVQVQETVGSPISDVWTKAGNIVTVGPNDNVFFVQEGVDGFYQIYFGDGVIGNNPNINSTISVTYLVTQGGNANGVQIFNLLTPLQNPAKLGVSIPGTVNSTAVSITVAVPANFGGDREDIESIRISAPKAYKAQNRCVTVSDYVATLQNQYGFIETVSVWGGQDNIPPQFGKVMVSIKPIYGPSLTPLTKTIITNNLVTNYAIAGITPILVDPDITYVYVTSDVFYRADQTNLSIGALTNIVQGIITQFFSSSVSFFNSEFRYSKFVAAIDAADNSVQGNETSLVMAKIFIPTPEVIYPNPFSFYNPIKPGTIVTNPFSGVSGQLIQLVDDGLGSMSLYAFNGSTFVLSKTGIGVVDYANGIVNLNSFIFDVFPNTTIVLKATPDTNDLQTVRNSLIVLENSAVTLTNSGS